MWENVEKNWDDPQAHSAFLEVATTENNLAFAATRYRAVKENEQQSSRRDVSEQQLARLTALAFARIDASHSPPPQPKKTVTFVAFVVSITLLGLCIYAFIQ